MKKMLLLLISGLLIACMAGSAVAPGTTGSTAGTLYIADDTPSHNIITQSIQIGQNDQKTIYLAASSPTAKTESYDVSVVRTNSGLIHLSASPTGQAAITLNLPAGVLTYYPIVLTTSDADIGEEYNLIVAGQTLTVSTTAEITTIPEFPTVAAPVAAVLGLLFVFGRKKGGL
jgi:hypothetical protein